MTKELKQPTPTEKKILSRYFIDFLIHDVMNGVDHEDILRVPITPEGKTVPNIIYYKGRKLDRDDVLEIYNDAILIKDSRLWKYMMNEMNSIAIGLMRKAKTEDDMYVAKLLMFWTDEAEKLISKFVVH